MVACDAKHSISTISEQSNLDFTLGSAPRNIEILGKQN